MSIQFSGIAYGAAVVEIPSSPNPVGSGARALGMGGAFIAIADDATAASWNPGGLIQLEKPEISFVLGYTNRNEAISFETNPESCGDQSIDNYSLNYLSAAYPFTAFGRNMIVSLNYQRLFDFNRHWIFNMDIGAGMNLTEDYEQEGALYALGLAYALELTPDLSVGVTLNYWGDFIFENKWEQTYNETVQVPFIGTVKNRFEEEFSFEGWNANVGFLWHVFGNWTLGGVFKAPFKADVDHTVRDNGVTIADSDDKLDMPMSYGIGISYRFSDAFTVAADAYRTHWEDFVYHPEAGDDTTPISGKRAAESDIDATTWYRLGVEYLYIGNKMIVPVRAGIFYDPAPAEGSSDKYYGFALGSGLAYGRFVWDIAYQYRFGNHVGESFLEHLGFSQDVDEHTVYTSLIIHFR